MNPIDAPEDKVYLSPHLDDAVYACGATIAAHVAAGRRVTVLTVCAGWPRGPLSDYAAAHHARWGLAANEAVEVRLAEDAAALARLGARAAYLDLPDAIYRRGSGGRACYPDEAALFGPLDADEAPLVGAVAAVLGNALGRRSPEAVRVPLALGGHVDHRLVRRAAERWAASLGSADGLPGGAGEASQARAAASDGRASASDSALARLVYYEDFPYVCDIDDIARADPGPPAGARAICRTVSKRALAARVAAMNDYRSQRSTFWPSRRALEAAVYGTAARRGDGELAECVWTGGRGTEDGGGRS